MCLYLLYAQLLFRVITDSLPVNGYYVPHWSYDGWGGPLYWGTLTLPANLSGDDPEIWKRKYKEAHGKEPADYLTCWSGGRQSPIDIATFTWSDSHGSVSH